MAGNAVYYNGRRPGRVTDRGWGECRTTTQGGAGDGQKAGRVKDWGLGRGTEGESDGDGRGVGRVTDGARDG